MQFIISLFFLSAAIMTKPMPKPIAGPPTGNDDWMVGGGSVHYYDTKGLNGLNKAPAPSNNKKGK